MTTSRFRVEPALRSTWGRCILVSALVFPSVGCGARTELYVEEEDPIDRLPECEENGDTKPCESICGTGVQICWANKWQQCDAPHPKPPILTAVVRDFRDSHPDFEQPKSGFDPGIVQDKLGDDDKPVYTTAGITHTTSGAANFNQWYNDSDVNIQLATNIPLAPLEGQASMFVYKNDAFFPIDHQGFGNQGRPHNFHFTLEVQTEFRYRGGETFRFTGDDDMWVFINRRLVIDLGGVHEPMTKQVRLDDVKDKVGLEKGEVYPLHLFFAERHTIESNFNIETTIAEFKLCE